MKGLQIFTALWPTQRLLAQIWCAFMRYSLQVVRLFPSHLSVVSGKEEEEKEEEVWFSVVWTLQNTHIISQTAAVAYRGQM